MKKTRMLEIAVKRNDDQTVSSKCYVNFQVTDGEKKACLLSVLGAVCSIAERWDVLESLFEYVKVIAAKEKAALTVIPEPPENVLVKDDSDKPRKKGSVE